MLTFPLSDNEGRPDNCFQGHEPQRNETTLMKVKVNQQLKPTLFSKWCISNENHHLVTLYSLPTNTSAQSCMPHNIFLMCQSYSRFLRTARSQTEFVMISAAHLHCFILIG